MWTCIPEQIDWETGKEIGTSSITNSTATINCPKQHKRIRQTASKRKYFHTEMNCVDPVSAHTKYMNGYSERSIALSNPIINLDPIIQIVPKVSWIQCLLPVQTATTPIRILTIIILAKIDMNNSSHNSIHIVRKSMCIPTSTVYSRHWQLSQPRLFVTCCHQSVDKFYWYLLLSLFPVHFKNDKFGKLLFCSFFQEKSPTH